MFTTAVISAVIMFGLALAISFVVAGLIKLMFVIVRRFGGDT